MNVFVRHCGVMDCQVIGDLPVYFFQKAHLVRKEEITRHSLEKERISSSLFNIGRSDRVYREKYYQSQWRRRMS